MKRSVAVHLKVTGTRCFTAPRSVVWAALHDVHCLHRCISGCERLRQTTENTFSLAVGVRFGPMRAWVEGDVVAAADMSGRRLRLHGQCRAGRLGEAIGHATIALDDVAGGCRLIYRIDVSPSGPLVAIGPVVLQAFAATLVRDFLAALRRELAVYLSREPVGRIATMSSGQ